MIFLFYDYVFFIQQLIAFGQICQSDTHSGTPSPFGLKRITHLYRVTFGYHRHCQRTAVLISLCFTAFSTNNCRAMGGSFRDISSGWIRMSN